MFDKDGSGVISADEIREVLGFGGNLDNKAIELIIRQVDENGDGEISFEEFVQMMKKIGEWADENNKARIFKMKRPGNDNRPNRNWNTYS